MALQRVTIRLTELRCLAQSESGGSEPYLWTTFFALGSEPRPFQTGPLAVDTPISDEFRNDFPNQMKAGQVALVPEYIGQSSFDMDLDAAGLPKMIGCVAVLLEQDSTPDSSIVLGRIAYSKEIEVQLNALMSKRIMTLDTSALTDEEIKTIKTAVQAKVIEAVKSDQSFWNIFKDQDDILGFVYKVFQHPPPANDPGADIRFQYFDFPEIRSGNSDRFTLTGRLSLGSIPTIPVDPCARERDALKAKTEQIQGLENLISSLQAQLQHASPAQKAALVQQITETGERVAAAEAELPALQAALDACRSRHHPGGPPIGTTVGAGTTIGLGRDEH